MANDNGNSGMEEQFEQLRQAISKDIAAQFESREVRLAGQFQSTEERLRGDFAAQFQSTEARLRGDFAAQFQSSEARLRGDLAAQFQSSEARLRGDLAAQFQSSEARLRGDLATQFQSSEARLRGDLDAKFRDSEERLHDKLAARFEAREERLLTTISQDVARQLETAVKHLDDRAGIYMEGMKELVTKAAEGYGGTLEAIDRRLGELAGKWDTTIADHSLARARVVQSSGSALSVADERRPSLLHGRAPEAS